MRQNFPSQPQGYIQGGFAALELNDIVLAEELATQAIKKFPHELQAFRLHAEVAMRSCAFDFALSRWARLRQHFPAQVAGYTQAGIAALELGKIAMAENLLTEAEKKFPNNAAVTQLRNKIDEKKQGAPQTRQVTLQTLLDVAEKDLRMGLFRQAFMHFKRAMKHSPEQIRSFSGAAEAAMKLQDYPRAEKIAGEMLLRFPLNITGYKYKIQSLEAQEEWTKILTALKRIKKNFPKNPYGWKKSAEILLKTGNYGSADAEMKDAVKLFPKSLRIFLYFAELPLFATDPEIWREAMERCLTACQKFPSCYEAYLQALNICRRLIRLQDTTEYRNAYCHLFKNFTYHFTIKSENTNYQSNGQKQVAIYSRRIMGLKYILPVLKHISPDSIDVVLQKKDKDTIYNSQIENYTILYGDEHLKKYKYIIIDANTLANKKIKNLDCNFIGYPHGSDANLVSILNHLSLAIFESKNQMINSNVLPCSPLPDWYTLPARANYKCELCYTGPYHIGEFLERRHEEKAKIKTELAEQLGIDIPNDKPLVFMLEDEICHMGQIAYAANRMARYATVIFKALLPPTDPRMTKFSSDVHVLRGIFVPNLLRFAADFVCCSYMSGSFTTSVMLGQNVLPYYSRLVNTHNLKKASFHMKRYDSISPSDQELRSAKHVLYSKFHEAGKLLDLVNTESFKKAILGTEYRDWYQTVLPSLQKEAFGDYLLEGAPQKTANYIMRFIEEGTLGKDCAAVYLKKKNFV